MNIRKAIVSGNRNRRTSARESAANLGHDVDRRSMFDKLSASAWISTALSLGGQRGTGAMAMYLCALWFSMGAEQGHWQSGHIQSGGYANGHCGVAWPLSELSAVIVCVCWHCDTFTTPMRFRLAEYIYRKYTAVLYIPVYVDGDVKNRACQCQHRSWTT